MIKDISVLNEIIKISKEYMGKLKKNTLGPGKAFRAII